MPKWSFCAGGVLKPFLFGLPEIRLPLTRTRILSPSFAGQWYEEAAQDHEDTREQDPRLLGGSKH